MAKARSWPCAGMRQKTVSASSTPPRTGLSEQPRPAARSASKLQERPCTCRSARAAGPPGKTATIDFNLSFKPEAAGRTFSVEAFATDDAGNQQGFESVGTLTVLPR